MALGSREVGFDAAILAVSVLDLDDLALLAHDRPTRNLDSPDIIEVTGDPIAAGKLESKRLLIDPELRFGPLGVLNHTAFDSRMLDEQDAVVERGFVQRRLEDVLLGRRDKKDCPVSSEGSIAPLDSRCLIHIESVVDLIEGVNIN